MAGLGELVGGIDAVAGAEKKQGLAALSASEKTWLHNQALFTLRRYAFAGTLALTALVGTMLKWGYQFNQTMAGSRAALEPVMGGAKNVNAELEQLYNFTKYTPFQFKDMTIAFRQMFAAFHPLGISVQDTNKTLFSLVNALAYAGRTTPGALNRVAVALQHMAYMGHLTGQTVIQLARDGLPIYDVLRKKLGLTGDEIHRVGALGIPTNKVIAALNAYMASTPGYMDAARRQAMTFGGMLTTLRDNISQVMGALTLGGYNKGPSFIGNLNKTFDQVGKIIQRNAEQGKGMAISWKQVQDIFVKSYPWLSGVFKALNLLWKYANAFFLILKNSLLPAIKDASFALIPLYLVMKLVGDILIILGHHGWILETVFAALIAQWILARTLMFAMWTIGLLQNAMWAVMWARLMIVTAWTTRFGYAELMAGAEAGNMNKAMAASLFIVSKLGPVYREARDALSLFRTGLVQSRAGIGNATFAYNKLQLYVLELRAAFLGAGGGIKGFVALIRVLGASMWTFLVELGPVGWIAIAIAGLTLLYFKWKWFHDFVNYFIKDLIKEFKPYIKLFKDAMPFVIPFVNQQMLLAKALQQIAHYAKEAAHWLGKVTGIHGPSAKSAASWAANIFTYLGPLGPNKLAGNILQHLAGGGSVTSPGSFMVGERGPEVVSLPVGATVTPGMASPLGMGFLNLTSVIQVDGRKLAEVTSKYRLDAQARA
jgi:hypothetical protein